MNRKEKMDEQYDKYKDMLYRIAFSNVKNRADAQDAVQETFVRLMVYEKKFENDTHEKAWLIRTVINICKDMLKSAWNNKTVGWETVPEQEMQHFVLPLIEVDETLWMVMELSEPYRNALYLFYYEGYSIKEISNIMEMPEATVKTHLRRGREILKKRIKQD